MKTYIQPEIQVYNIQINNILVESGLNTVVEGEISTADGIAAKGTFNFIGESDEEDVNCAAW